MDTQLPRWEVFKQDTYSRPHQAVGSVHAADPAHALLTARNVFARRPLAVSMWVALAEDIHAWTKEEVEGEEFRAQGHKRPAPDTRTRAFCVFRKTTHKRSMTFVDYVGELEASSPEEALELARGRFAEVEALAWWVVPADKLVRSEAGEEVVESWFAPARDKTYKQQQFYATVGSHVSKHKAAKAADDEY
ncbi:MAG: phenylacetic acid degradation protein [Meiothermus sp.]|nr:phenylacetic acid degradation protein [Meiothermus sp.]